MYMETIAFLIPQANPLHSIFQSPDHRTLRRNRIAQAPPAAPCRCTGICCPLNLQELASSIRRHNRGFAEFMNTYENHNITVNSSRHTAASAQRHRKYRNLHAHFQGGRSGCTRRCSCPRCSWPCPPRSG
jgi:hypothetical protein